MGLFDRLRKLVGRAPAPEPRHAVRLAPVPPAAAAQVERPQMRPIAQAIAELDVYEDDDPIVELPDPEVLAQLKLPSLPTFALKAAELSRDLATPARDIADAIGLDPGLATRVLRAANSPLYGFERHVTTLPGAVTALGNQAVNNLVVVFAASDVMQGSGPLSKRERALWRHSMGVAFAAREIAGELKMRGTDEAFLCGLLHDIGKLFLIRHDPDAYEYVLETSDESEALRRERERFRTTHPVVGAAVALKWGLPEQVIRAISLHHQPGEASTYLALVRSVDLANLLSTQNGYGLRAPDPLDVSQTESAIAFELTAERLAEIWDRSQLAALEAIHLFA